MAKATPRQKSRNAASTPLYAGQPAWTTTGPGLDRSAQAADRAKRNGLELTFIRHGSDVTNLRKKAMLLLDNKSVQGYHLFMFDIQAIDEPAVDTEDRFRSATFWATFNEPTESITKRIWKQHDVSSPGVRVPRPVDLAHPLPQNSNPKEPS